ncbi:unnamed protein product [Candida verbasci]|uniref:1-phosphatidylinositol-4-phosphate 5-kinase n=1 Tax=Candida verbasci TaxID=1227364 RepID=A0A9W4XAF3_9ASCO|nr:unnamed protein product [Candida verbasci]
MIQLSSSSLPKSSFIKSSSSSATNTTTNISNSSSQITLKQQIKKPTSSSSIKSDLLKNGCSEEQDETIIKLPLLTSQNLNKTQEMDQSTSNEVNNRMPSTPTSFKGSNTDYTNETTPSSIDDNNQVAQSLKLPNDNELTTAKLSLDIDPLNTTNSTIHQDIPKNTRRHTSPVLKKLDKTISLSRHSIQIEKPTARSTYPQFSQDVPVSNEIQLLRDSFVQKRNIRKFYEDETVLGSKVTEGHDNFVMAYNMLTGIRVAVSRCSGVMKKLQDSDFHSYKKLTFNTDGSELTPSSKYDFKFKDYCPEVFRELRVIFGIDPADYLISITGKYILSQLNSPGKSGSFFYYSRDYRFIIKTIKRSEKNVLLRILKDYHSYIKTHPNTLISQFFGLHRVKMRGRKVHFVVMNNLFPPHYEIHEKFDLKGSLWGRLTTNGSTLKDLNYLQQNKKIKFGPEKKRLFFQQIESDVNLLKKCNVMDYSLLLGIHDVTKGNTGDINQKLSVFEPKSSDKAAIINTNPRDLNRTEDLPNDVFPGRSKYVFYGHNGGIRATNCDNEPIGEIYYMGIIDCLTPYSCKKKLETLIRSIGHKRNEISAIPAKEYGDRFVKFIKDGTSNTKRKIG